MERVCSWLVLLIVIMSTTTLMSTDFSAFAAGDKVSPKVKILSPAPDSSLSQGQVIIQGTAGDNRGGSGVKVVQIRIDSGEFSNATPKSLGDWSSWSASQSFTTPRSYRIEAKAIDFAGNQKTNEITITILGQSGTTGTASLSITPPPNITSEAIGILTTIDIGTPIVIDDIDFSPSVTNNAPSLFPIGATIVTWTVTDFAGNTASADQVVKVVDTTSPSITAPVDVFAESTNDQTSVNLGTPIVNDLVDSTPTVTNNAPVTFPIGSTLVTWTATDFSGNSASAFQTVTITESPNDQFGIKKIYPSKAEGQKWYMNTENIVNDAMFSTIPPASTTCTTPTTCTLLYKNVSENIWHEERKDVPANEGIRMVVQAQPDKPWLNTEMTGYYRLKSSIYYPQEFIHVIRSGTPHASTCQGYSYYAGISFDGSVAKIQKALYHGGDGLGYSQTFFTRGVTTPLDNRWIGMKTVTYNVDNNTAVKIEIWLDEFANNNWRKVYEQVDNGWGIPGDPANYGCINPLTGLPRTSNDIILWGGTEQQFRADNAEIDFNLLSIREIAPPQ
ncbi:MAG TPA: HYR domain-containing protein [Nitrosopumilaceae archaeon]|nr:HYR domain-containing protein [Nitrosopumilaceae archaeon]